MGAAWQFAGSLAAVAAMIALAWRFGFSGTPQLADEAEARAIADGLPGGFAARDVALSQDRTAALLRDGGGRIALVFAHGAHFVARLLGPADKARADGEVLAVTVAARTAMLALDPAAAVDWASAIDRLG